MVAWSARQDSGAGRTITVKPNRSLTWGQTKTLLLGFASALLAVAAYFWHLGAWMVIPFLGVELLLIAGAFYFHSLRSSRGESIEFDEENMWVKTGSGRTGFPRPWIQVKVVRTGVPGHPNRLLVGAHGRFLQIGTFLHDRERELLASLVEETAAQRV